MYLEVKIMERYQSPLLSSDTAKDKEYTEKLVMVHWMMKTVKLSLILPWNVVKL